MVRTKSSFIDRFEIIPIKEIPSPVRLSWIQRLKPVLDSLSPDHAIKIETTEEEVNIIRASWRKVALDLKPHTKTIRNENDPQRRTIFLWVEKELKR